MTAPAEAARPAVIPTWIGVVTHLHICPHAGAPMQPMRAIDLVAGEGIVGDRYRIGTETGYYSNKPEPGRQVTLFEIEALECIRRDHDIVLTPGEHRRNVTVQGVPLNHLVGRRFRLGSCLLEATRLSFPCRYIEDLLGKPVFKPMVHRSGLNCRIIEGGRILPGDAVRPEASRGAA
jgi:MOSC domain-containing protein YiiM